MELCRAGLHDLDAPDGRKLVKMMRRGKRANDSTVCAVCRVAAARKRNTAWRARLRDQFLEMYGGRCACCGVARRVFLALDHVQNDGWIERRRGDNGAPTTANTTVYRRAVAEHQPDRYQILCHNCNMAKQIETDHTCEGSLSR
jgi:hypothetical protein